MSVEASHPDPSKSKHHKKPKDRTDKKEKKKRKRDVQDEDVPIETLPSKRHRSSKKHQELIASSPPPPTSYSQDHSPFYRQTSSLYLPLSPIAQLHPLQGLCAEHLSPLILTYYAPFRGVILSYSNARLSEDPHGSGDGQNDGIVLAKSVDEYAVSFVWVTAEFLIFKPQKGGWIEGWINLQNESHVGLVCWNLFNASIERRHLPKDWKWIGEPAAVPSKTKLKGSHQSLESENGEVNGVMEPKEHEVEQDEGHFEDVEGNRIEGSLMFRIRDVETSPSTDREKGFLSIEGTLMSEKEEKDELEQQHIRSQASIGRGLYANRPRQSEVMSGALQNGQLNS